MPIRSEALATHLAKDLAPIYLIHGDEPLLVGEAADQVRAAARTAGYGAREVFDAGPAFEWQALQTAARNLSLFSERRVLELRLASGKPGVEGAKCLQAYAEDPAPDTLLLIVSPKLERSAQSSRWFKSLDDAGVVVQLYPIAVRDLPRWIQARMRSRGLQPEAEAVRLLAERVEGNLLAAAQEIERLALLHGKGPLSAPLVAESVADSARFDVYKLADSALAGDAARSARILAGLRAEGDGTTLVLWALAREVRLLVSMAYDVAEGQRVEQVLAAHRVWESRKALYRAALGRSDRESWVALLRLCARADRAIKGLAAGEPWDLLQQIGMGVAGADLHLTSEAGSGT